MRDQLDRIIQLATLMSITAWVSVLLASQFKQAIQIYFFLSLTFAIIWVLDTCWHLFKARRFLLRLEERVRSPYVLGAFALFLAGIYIVNPNVKAFMMQMAPSTLEFTTLELQMLPSLTVLSITFLILTLSTFAKSKIEKKVERRIAG